jgi:hypothetical protein
MEDVSRSGTLLRACDGALEGIMVIAKGLQAPIGNLNTRFTAVNVVWSVRRSCLKSVDHRGLQACRSFVGPSNNPEKFPSIFNIIRATSCPTLQRSITNY